MIPDQDFGIGQRVECATAPDVVGRQPQRQTLCVMAREPYSSNPHIGIERCIGDRCDRIVGQPRTFDRKAWQGSEEHTSELQSLMRISYAVFCLKKKTLQIHANNRQQQLKTSML